MAAWPQTEYALDSQQEMGNLGSNKAGGHDQRAGWQQGPDQRTLEMLPNTDDAPIPPGRVYCRRWLMLALYFVTTMINQAMSVGFSVIQRTVKEECGVSDYYVSTLTVVFMAAFLVMFFPSAYITDVYGCRISMTIAAVLQATGALLRYALPFRSPMQPAVMMIGQIFAAVGQPFFMGIPPKLAAVWFPDHQRALADVLGTMSWPAGLALGQSLGVLFGLRGMLRIHVAWTLVCAVAVIALFRAKPPSAASATSDRPHVGKTQFFRELMSTLRNGQVLLMVTVVAGTLGFNSYYQTLVSPLNEPYGITQEDMMFNGNMAFVGNVLATVFTVIAVNFISDHRKMLIGFMATALVSTATLPVVVSFLSGKLRLALLGAASIGIGLGTGNALPLAFEAAVHAAFPAGESTVACISLATGQLTGIITVQIGNLLMAHSLVGVAWVLVPCFFLAGTVAAVCFRPPRHHAGAEAPVAATTVNGNPLLDKP